jgi:hypothetical protein
LGPIPNPQSPIITVDEFEFFSSIQFIYLIIY